MNYIENIYICLAAPLIITILCIRTKGQKMMTFVLGGMTVCLLSSYISTFFAAALNADALTASLTIAPIVEEIMKLFPVMFFLLVYEPGREDIGASVLMTAVGFATFENVCYLAQNGADKLMYLMVRGFGTGAMHVVCGALIGIGIIRLWDITWLRISGTLGILATATAYHGIYNMLVTKPGIPSYIGYFIPLFTVFAIVIPVRNRIMKREMRLSHKSDE